MPNRRATDRWLPNVVRPCSKCARGRRRTTPKHPCCRGDAERVPGADAFVGDLPIARSRRVADRWRTRDWPCPESPLPGHGSGFGSLSCSCPAGRSTCRTTRRFVPATKAWMPPYAPASPVVRRSFTVGAFVVVPKDDVHDPRRKRRTRTTRMHRLAVSRRVPPSRPVCLRCRCIRRGSPVRPIRLPSTKSRVPRDPSPRRFIGTLAGTAPL